MSNIHNFELSQTKVQWQEKLGNFIQEKGLQLNGSDNARQACTQTAPRIQNEPDPVVARIKMSQIHLQLEFSFSVTAFTISWVVLEVYFFLRFGAAVSWIGTAI